MKTCLMHDAQACYIIQLLCDLSGKNDNKLHRTPVYREVIDSCLFSDTLIHKTPVNTSPSVPFIGYNFNLAYVLFITHNSAVVMDR